MLTVSAIRQCQPTDRPASRLAGWLAVWLASWACEDAVIGCESHNMGTDGAWTDLWGASTWSSYRVYTRLTDWLAGIQILLVSTLLRFNEMSPRTDWLISTDIFFPKINAPFSAFWSTMVFYSLHIMREAILFLFQSYMYFSMHYRCFILSTPQH